MEGFVLELLTNEKRLTSPVSWLKYSTV